MSLWVCNEKNLNMQCSKVISKDVRAARRDSTTQEPTRAQRITRLLFEILLLCLRCTRLERKSTKNHSKIVSKDVRAIRNDCTTQEPRRALRITRLLFEIPLLCLRCTWLEQKSTKNRSKMDENPFLIDPRLTKNRFWVVLGAQKPS